jgi:hypothetical protein
MTGQPERGFLVGQRDIDALEANKRKARDGLLEIPGLDRQGNIGRIKAKPVDPEPVKRWRKRMGDRPAGNPGKHCTSGDHQLLTIS